MIMNTAATIGCEDEIAALCSAFFVPTIMLAVRFSRCRTVWIRATAEDHWNRVVAQGDQRPMADHPHAFAELRALMTAREKLYARAEHTVDTTGRRVAQVVAAITDAVD